MTPAERASSWRQDHPTTQEPEAQRKIVQAWVDGTASCPYELHRSSYEIRSKRSGLKQQQLLIQGVRLSRSVVTWFCLHGEWCHPDDLEFHPRSQKINRRFSLE
jgi:hypothetical protein